MHRSHWILLGSLFGFLFLNWSSAKVFMGDVGSTFLGAVFAGFVLHSASVSQGVSLLLVLSPIFGDAFFTFLRRLISGYPIFCAHRQHLFQRLNDAGWSHHQVASSYLIPTTLLACAFLFSNISLLLFLLFVFGIIALWLNRFVAVPFSF